METKTSYEKWDTCCLIRELDQKIAGTTTRQFCSRYYIVNQFLNNSPSSLGEKYGGGGRNFAFLINHLLQFWDDKAYPMPSDLEEIRSALQKRRDEFVAEHGPIPI